MATEAPHSKAHALAQIRQEGLVPILRTPTAEDALEIAELLRESGLSSVEVTLTVPGALDVIRELAVSFSPDLLVGAGSVLEIDQAIAAHEAGARFIVMPAFEASVIGYCRANGIACFPGALTPTEVVTAWRAGADAIKVFPVGAMGGASYIKALKEPLPQIPLMPTGGITLENVATFIHAGAYAVGVGGDLSDVKALREGRRHVIVERARLYKEVTREARNQASRTPAPPPPDSIDVKV